MTLRRCLVLLAPVLAVLVPGCGSSPAEVTPSGPCDEVTCTGVETFLDDAPCCAYPFGQLDVDFSACPAGVSEEAIHRTAAVGIWLHRSMRALGDGVQLGFELASNANSVLVKLAEAPELDALQAPFSFDEATGEYKADVSSTGQGTVTARFSFSADYQAGMTGDPIRPYLFRTSSYVTGAKISLGNGSATVAYDAEGPLVELLGFGAHPPNPFELGLLEPTDLPKQTMDLTIADEEIGPDGFTGNFEAHLRRRIGEGPLKVSAEDFPIELTTAAFSGAGGAKIDMIDAQLSAIDAGFDARVRGAIHFRITGGAAPIAGVISYDELGKSELQLLCGSGG